MFASIEHRAYQMVLLSLVALSLAFISPVNAAPPVASGTVGVGSPVQTTGYPIALQGNLQVHDPSVIRYNNNYYAFTGGVSIPYFKASNMSGPWESLGTVLNGPSVIQREGREDPWAPNVMEYNGSFYCYYAVSRDGTRESSIGVAITADIDRGPWTDLGEIIATGTGLFSSNYPYSASNAIDPSVLIDPKNGQPYLAWGSYWTNIWQAPLASQLTSVEDREDPDAVNLAYDILPGEDNAFLKSYPATREPDGTRPVEGSFMYYREPWYYLWFSHGQCCNFESTLPPAGDEYSIRVGRSATIQGPYVDESGTNLTDGGGTIIYGSNNNGVVYAPGGQGIMSGAETGDFDILYYHYLNEDIGLNYDQAQLGYNYLDYVDGWPSVIAGVPVTVTETATMIVMATPTATASATVSASTSLSSSASASASESASASASANPISITNPAKADTTATPTSPSKSNAAPKTILQTPTYLIILLLFVCAYI
ncbi:CAZyme family GH43 [Paecilomyces variotii]|nr:CAZyme family GH43 [Paecilomyces variotii]KAJ9260618.1 CAZyme family GH43 [Paecilomyces variotii]KAJ9289827.1 CAZyme family GH43 [Paecilomyces variotii]KAJ9323689.1 CAZyme family GH43 [Paecilomyces variotii]KAJ9335399.1 CAZyme family GH43 [Paecilomyces variotii]